ncbi:hypothetical protein CCMA1212_008458 [Trichoderma ghanense]|uniref:Uncharacterized protein n=1 Tax=Trichoderma ghanense TaxID=65468 RepID=A0ABY2GUH1_9HYPO
MAAFNDDTAPHTTDQSCKDTSDKPSVSSPVEQHKEPVGLLRAPRRIREDLYPPRAPSSKDYTVDEPVHASGPQLPVDKVKTLLKDILSDEAVSTALDPRPLWTQFDDPDALNTMLDSACFQENMPNYPCPRVQKVLPEWSVLGRCDVVKLVDIEPTELKPEDLLICSPTILGFRFLTTNRMQTFDRAILSRIPPPSKVRAAEEGGSEAGPAVCDDDIIKALAEKKLNGREDAQNEERDEDFKV